MTDSKIQTQTDEDFYIVWNEKKSEGFITSNRDMADAALDGASQTKDVYPTKIAALFFTNTVKDKTFMEKVSISKDKTNDKIKIEVKSTFPKSREKKVEVLSKKIWKLIDRKDARGNPNMNGQVAGASLSYIIAKFVSYFRQPSKNEEDLIDYIGQNAKNIILEFRKAEQNIKIKEK